MFAKGAADEVQPHRLPRSRPPGKRRRRPGHRRLPVQCLREQADGRVATGSRSGRNILPAGWLQETGSWRLGESASGETHRAPVGSQVRHLRRRCPAARSGGPGAAWSWRADR
jgi:hypothetical protein